MTPPPRSRRNLGAPQATPSAPAVSRGSNTLTPAPSQPPPGSAASAAIAHDVQATHGLAPYGAPQPHELPSVPHRSAPGGHQGAALVPMAPGSSPRSGPQLPNQTRKAWKKSGPTIGRASGLLLLALAGLVILGGLFVVFSLLE
jgi:hypothetical protein